MTSFMFLLMMQYVISTKAGLVNYVQGDVNVAVSDLVPSGSPVKTGTGAFAEILLNPGSFLRMGENAQVVLDSVDLTSIAVRVLSGTVLVETSEIDKAFPIKVTTGNVSVRIVESGLFRFEDGKATILVGSLETADTRIPYKKGWSVISRDNVYRSLKVAKNEDPTLLETWSEARSALMFVANNQTYQTFRRAGVGSYPSSWAWVPNLGLWTYFPYTRTRSPYGNSYRSYSDVSGGSVGYSSRGDGGGAENSSPSPGGFGSSGGSGAGAGGGYSPANDRPTYRESVPMKNAPKPPGGGE